MTGRIEHSIAPRRRFEWFCVPALCAVMLTACVGGTDVDALQTDYANAVEQETSALVGKSEAELIGAMGVPADTYELGDGSRILSFVREDDYFGDGVWKRCEVQATLGPDHTVVDAQSDWDGSVTGGRNCLELLGS